MINNFRWAIASVIGTSHIKSGTRKQDWARCFQVKGESGEILFGIVSDGAGSASFGGQGAALICSCLSHRIRQYFKNKEIMPDDAEIWSWIDSARDLISESANKKNISRREYSATLVAIIATKSEVLTLHIGDGSIVARKPDNQWVSLSWPESGEYASTTYFLIDDPAPKLRITRFENEFNAFSLFSDGIENLALDFQAQVPHPPFFNSLLKAVDDSTSSGNIGGLSIALSSFLNSSKVNERTDDDKSLIIISVK